MRRSRAAAGSALFFLVAPGTIVGVIPWLLTGWRLCDPLPGWMPLRAVGAGRRREEVSAVELEPAEAAEFIRDVLAPHARRTRLGRWFVRHIDGIDIDHPVEAAQGRPVFELHAMSDGPGTGA